MNRRAFLAAMTVLPTTLAHCAAREGEPFPGNGGAARFEVTKTEAEWRKTLTPLQFRILRNAYTEPPGSSPLNEEHRPGTFYCAGCDLPLFPSIAKFDSGTGWPSFTASLDRAIGTSVDRTVFGVQTEVHCRRCGGHLGHVFDDGPRPTGKRFCMNGGAMIFKPL